MKYLLVIVASVALFAGQANAAFIVVPNSLETTEGGANNLYPFSQTQARYQQVFDSSQFGSDPIFISEVAFRPDAEFGAAFSVTLSNVLISLSTTSASPDSLSTTFANNVGGDDMEVFTGSLSLSSSFLGPDDGPKAFDISIPFSSSFLYKPLSGNNLLLDVTIFAGHGATGVFDVVNATDAVSRVTSAESSSLIGTADSVGLVAGFTTQVVPIPGAIWLLGSGLVGLVGLRKKLKK